MVLLIAAILLTALHLQKEKPVLTCGSYAMTNTQLGYYYWSEFFYYADAYGSWLGDAVDWTLPLDLVPTGVVVVSANIGVAEDLWIPVFI